MKEKYTLREICEIEGISIPTEYMSQADEPISMITCFGNRIGKGGALFPRGLDETGKKASYNLNERGARRAYENGARFIFSKEQYYGENGEKLPCVIIDNPQKTFAKLCKKIRDSFSDEMVTVAISGSVGKTTTTEMVRIIASENRKTYSSQKNTNGFASIANHMQNINDDVKVYIQEVGAYFPGLVEDGATILEPNACIITNIGPSHIDLYGSLENIAHDKLALARHLKPNGMAFLNYDDPILRKADLNCNITWFSLNDSNADYYADNIVYHEGHIEYDIIHNDEKTHIMLSCYGFHNIINSLAAFAFGRWIGLSGEEIATALGKFKVKGMRENLCNVGGYRLFIDCFNSAPNSLEGAIKTIMNIKVGQGNKRIAVLGDMLKMGELSEKLHTDCGRVISQYDVDLFICYGPYMKYMAQELEKAGKTVLYTNDRYQLNDYINENISLGDLILFKAGHKMALAKNIDQIFGTSYYISDIDVLLDKGADFKTDLFSGKIVDGMAEIRKYLGADTKITIPSTINGVPVYRIGADSFNRNRTMEDLVVEEGVTNIGFAAFYICPSLKKVTLPSTLKIIERNAFNYCIELEEITIPANVTDIDKRAFYDCKKLKKIVIGPNVKHIAERVFSNCPEVTIHGKEGSYAEVYAKENKIPFITMDDSDCCVLGGQTEKNCEENQDRTELYGERTVFSAGRKMNLVCPICCCKHFSMERLAEDGEKAGKKPTLYVCKDCGYGLQFYSEG